MTELQLLKQQKREIEERIKQLTNQAGVNVGGAKLTSRKFYRDDENGGKEIDFEWTISVAKKWAGSTAFTSEDWKGKRIIWNKMIIAKTREEALAEIPYIMSELRKLYAEATKKPPVD